MIEAEAPAAPPLVEEVAPFVPQAARSAPRPRAPAPPSTDRREGPRRGRGPRLRLRARGAVGDAASAISFWAARWRRRRCGRRPGHGRGTRCVTASVMRRPGVTRSSPRVARDRGTDPASFSMWCGTSAHLWAPLATESLPWRPRGRLDPHPFRASHTTARGGRAGDGQARWIPRAVARGSTRWRLRRGRPAPRGRVAGRPRRGRRSRRRRATPACGPPHSLLAADPTLRVVVLEAEIAGFGASGRNGGWCSALFPASAAALARRHGRPAALALRRAMNATVGEVGRAAAEEGIDVHWRAGGTVVLARTPVQLARASAAVAEDGAFDGVDGLELLDAGAARDGSARRGCWAPPTRRTAPACTPRASSRGLARVVERRGGRRPRADPGARGAPRRPGRRPP